MSAPPARPSGGNAASETEAKLREALEAVAGRVGPPAPGAYRAVSADWRRRERRRKLVLAALSAVVFTLAVLAGLWVLNSAPADHDGIFHDGPPSPAASPARPAP
ncbi:hypothetical protein ACWDR0_33655 [Streptomyces sp. NPDC003691]